MIGQRVGYVRVSSFDQNAERQLEDVELDRTFRGKASGKDAKRPQCTVPPLGRDADKGHRVLAALSC